MVAPGGAEREQPAVVGASEDDAVGDGRGRHADRPARSGAPAEAAGRGVECLELVGVDVDARGGERWCADKAGGGERPERAAEVAAATPCAVGVEIAAT